MPCPRPLRPPGEACCCWEGCRAGRGPGPGRPAAPPRPPCTGRRVVGTGRAESTIAATSRAPRQSIHASHDHECSTIVQPFPPWSWCRRQRDTGRGTSPQTQCCHAAQPRHGSPRAAAAGDSGQHWASKLSHHHTNLPCMGGSSIACIEKFVPYAPASFAMTPPVGAPPSQIPIARASGRGPLGWLPDMHAADACYAPSLLVAACQRVFDSVNWFKSSDLFFREARLPPPRI